MARRNKKSKSGGDDVKEEGQISKEEGKKQQNKQSALRRSLETIFKDVTQSRGTPRRSRRGKSGSEDKGETSHQDVSSARIGNSDLASNQNVQGIHSKALSSTLSSYKIPKKKARNAEDNVAPGASVQEGQSSVRTSKLTSATKQEVGVNLENGIRKRKSEAVENVNNKRTTAGHAIKQNVAEIPTVEFGTPTNPSSSSRPTLTAARRLRLPADKPTNSGGAAQGKIVDTPQMALLRAKIMGTSQTPKGKPVNVPQTPRGKTLDSSQAPRGKVANTSQAPRAKVADTSQPQKEKVMDTPQITLLKAQMADRNANEKKVRKRKKKNKKISETCNTTTSTSSSQDSSPMKTTGTPSGISPTPPLVFTNSETMDISNRMPEIMQLVGNDLSNSRYEEMDTPDAMDVDIIQPGPNHFKQLLLVLDTNVWISNRPLIQRIIDADFVFQTAGPAALATVVIPWMVLQELDHKIHRKSGDNTGFRNAAKYIHELLSAKHPRVKGQKATEAIIGMEFSELMADDSILNCAIQYDKLPQYTTVLVTNDINLLNKALVNNLTAFKGDGELISNLRKLFSEEDSQIISELGEQSDATTSSSFLLQNSFCSSPMPPLVSHTPDISIQSNNLEDVVMDVDDPMGMEQSCNNFNNSSGNVQDNQHRAVDRPTFEAVATALQQTLTSIIVPKMVEDFGKDDWKFAIKIPPPFTVESGLKCIQAHWIAVFSYLFPSRGKEVVDELVNIFKQKPGGPNAMDVKTWRLTICQMSKVLLSLNNNIASQPRVSDCCRLLQEYIQFETNS